jgi:phosphonate degradation associated HDIG domain protein
MAVDLYEEVVRLFETRGRAAYFGEDVSQVEHALQAAYWAEQEGASNDLVVAALLHDVGHLVSGADEAIADCGIDARHELAGFAWLARSFGPAVTEPIRLHVAAKRYLCAVDPGYADGLSSASKQSLELQGGAFGSDEIRAFESEPHHSAAVRLRRWDDAAKVPGLVVPGIDHYRRRFDAALAAAPR